MFDKIAEEIDKLLPQMHGWTSPIKAKLLARTVYDNKLTSCLEVGVYGGASAIPVALALKALGTGTIACVDPWDPEASAMGQEEVNAKWWRELDHNAILSSFKGFRYALGLYEYMPIYRMTNKAYYEQLTGAYYDYLNIDANHSVEESVWDIQHFVPLVKVGGYIWQDDIHWQNRSDAYELLKTMGVEEIATIDTGVLVRKIK